MWFGFKLSHRLARGFFLGALTATLAACAMKDVTQPTDSTNPVRTITLTPRTASLAISGTLQLSALLQDSTGETLAGRAITWTSDVTRVATVSTNGLVQAADTGTATITASSEGKHATATITVTAGSIPNPPSPGAHTGYFVTPSGSSSADGSMAHPWTLSAALAGASGHVQPGDTVWLRGGTYHGTFSASVGGSSGKPVVFRQYPGERAIIDGAGAAGSATIFNVRAPWVVLWGFEITNSDANRTYAQTGNAGRACGIAVYASHTKYISLIVHDVGVGIYNDADQSDVEIAGSVWYNNGWQGPDRGHGHAIYIRSNTGPVLAHDNIMFDQFGYGVHVYTNPGEAKLNNVHIENNIAFNNGTLATNSQSSNILFGGDDTADQGVVSGNMTWFPATLGVANMLVGYGSLRNGSVTVTDNYAAGGSPVLSMGYWSSVTASGNVFAGTQSVLSLNDPSLSASKFSGQTASTLPTTTKVFVRAVANDPGRANIAVYNWGQNGSVTVNLNGIVPQGAKFDIRNVQDLFGTPVVSGTYSGGSVSLPIRAAAAPTPVGWQARSPATGTLFNAYVVTVRN